MIIKARISSMNMVGSKDGPRYRLTFSASDLSAEAIGMLSTFAGKGVTLEIVPGEEQLELFASNRVGGDGDQNDGGDVPESPEDGPESPDEPGPGGYRPPGWRD